MTKKNLSIYPPELLISIPSDCWDGWRLTPSEQDELIRLTINEFEKFPKKRRKPEQLVKQVVGMSFGQRKNKRRKYKIKQKNEEDQ